MTPLKTLVVAAFPLVLLPAAGGAQETEAVRKRPAPTHGVRPESLLVRNVMVIRGNGTPAIGPTDVLVKGNVIESIGGFSRMQDAATEIDGTGKYLLPGFVNMHGHIQQERARIPIPVEYQMNLWLASGITTIRDLGSELQKSLEYREQSARGEIVAPRIFLYPFCSGGRTPQEASEMVRRHKESGVSGLKLYSLDRDQMDAILAEAHKLGLPCTIHMGVEETNAWDVVRLKFRSIEHWYGIPDAALPGLQHFPAEFSYSNEVHRFRYAGRLWREADPLKLEKVLRAMVEAGVAWDPTLAIYEASRDLVRAQNQPWFKDYLHPALAKFFEPDLENHGSYFLGWTNTDEVYWKENYRIWMKAVLDFARMGGVVTTGEDAGFIYVMYGFGLLREIELHEEAGFQPIECIQHATFNGAKVLGESERIGRVRVGHLADLIVVNGNPLENLHVLNPLGTTLCVDGKPVQGGGIEWTIKDGIPYHGPTLLAEVREIVAKAREGTTAVEGSR